MPRISEEALERVCLRVWADDYEYLRTICKSQGSLSLNLLIRQIIRRYVMELRDVERHQQDKIPDNKLGPLDPGDLELIRNLAETEEAEEEARLEAENSALFPTVVKGNIVDITL